MTALLAALTLTLAKAMPMALPPQSDEQLQQSADRVVVARVVEVTHREVKVQDGIDRVYTAKVKPEGPSKEGLEVTFRQTWERPQGWAGPAGQNEPLPQGSRVRLFLQRNGDGWRLLEPNGWVRLDQDG